MDTESGCSHLGSAYICLQHFEELPQNWQFVISFCPEKSEGERTTLGANSCGTGADDAGLILDVLQGLGTGTSESLPGCPPLHLAHLVVPDVNHLHLLLKGPHA